MTNGEQAPGPKILFVVAVCLTSIVSLLSVLSVFWSGQYLIWVATRGDAIDVWTLLTLFEIACNIGGVLAAWLMIRRRKPGWALPFLALPFVGGFVIEANRCDVFPACAWSQWATLPQSAYKWKVPIRKSREADLGRRGPDRGRTRLVLKALDGDTLLYDGKVVRIAGIDAPELGQTAKCWAEAALGGESRNALDGAISGPRAKDWQLAEVSDPDAEGRIRANLITEDGDDLRDHMAVYGFAARTEGRWNWCGPDPDLHDRRRDGQPPRGPSMWWPADHLYDARAAD